MMNHFVGWFTLNLLVFVRVFHTDSIASQMLNTFVDHHDEGVPVRIDTARIVSIYAFFKSLFSLHSCHAHSTHLLYSMPLETRSEC